MRTQLRSGSLLTLLVFFASAHCHGGQHDDVTKTFGGPENRSLLISANRVEVYRVDGSFHHKEVPGEKRIAGYPLIAGPVVMEKAAADTLGKTLNSDDTYQFRHFKTCIFDPGYVARFIKGDKVMDVALCFHCEELRVLIGDQQVGMAPMDPGAEKLLAQLKPLFPEPPATAPSHRFQNAAAPSAIANRLRHRAIAALPERHHETGKSAV